MWKLLYGTAFRTPNVYESFYFFPDTQIANPALLSWWSLRLGAEGQWPASRKSDAGTVPSYGVANLTVLRPQAKDGWELSASLFNLFDRKYADPTAFDPALPAHDRLEQDGRSFRIKAIYHF